MVVGGLLATTSRASANPVQLTNTSAAVAFQLDAAHDGFQTDPDFPGANQTVLWSKDLGGQVGYPLISGDTVYAVVANTMANGTITAGTSVSAYARDTGAVKWGPVQLAGVFNFGAIALDGGQIFALNYGGKLFALDAATGVETWSEQLPGQYAFTSPPTAINGTVFVSGAGTGGTLYAVDAGNGTVLWTASVANGDHSSPAVDSTGVYISYACEATYSFTTGGDQRWAISPGCVGGGGRTPVLHNGEVFVRGVTASPAPAALSETDGSQLWTFAAQTAPAIDVNDEAVVTTSGAALLSSDLTTHDGNWLHTGGASVYVTAPLIVNGYVIEGDSAGVVHMFDAHNGEEVWHASAGAPIAAPNENDAVVLTGLAEAQGVLAVPAGNRLTVFGAPSLSYTSAPDPYSLTGPRQTFAFTTNVPSPTFFCQLDSADRVVCASPFTLSALSTGLHSLVVTAASGSAQASTTWNFATDGVLPTARVGAVSQFSNAWTTTHSWSGTDADSGLLNYDVRYRLAAAQQGFTAFQQPAALQATTSTSLTLRPAPGSTVCLSVRSRDVAGNVSAWTPDSCQSVLLDDRALSVGGSWSRPGGVAGYANGTYSRTVAAGPTLTLSNIHARRVAIVATTCPTCGRVSVSFAGMAPTTVNLRSTQTVKQTFYAFAQLGKTSVGSVKLTSLDAGKPVIVDAVSAWQN
jgi:outer membrane protein assembly factor BamB